MKFNKFLQSDLYHSIIKIVHFLKNIHLREFLMIYKHNQVGDKVCERELRDPVEKVNKCIFSVSSKGRHFQSVHI